MRVRYEEARFIDTLDKYVMPRRTSPVPVTRVQLEQFTRWVMSRTTGTPGCVVCHATTDDRGRGLYATRPIKRGALVVLYGGPCVPIDSNPSRTHSLRVSERHLPESRIQGVVVDGTALSHLVRSNDPADPLLAIAGALMNSSRGSRSEPNIRRSDGDAMFARGRISAARFAAARFIALRDIAPGEELLWDYAVRFE